MKAPPRLQSLIEEGLIDTVVRQLMSGAWPRRACACRSRITFMTVCC